MNWFKPSSDGKLVAVCLSQGGDEVGDVTVFDVGDRQAGRRGRPARQHRHRRRRPRLGARRLGLLLHPPSARGRAAGRGHELLPAGLLSQAGHADGRRPLRAGQGLAANRRDRAEDRRPHRPRAGDDPERRRRRVRPLPPRARRQVAAVQQVRGQDHPGRVRARTTTCTSCRVSDAPRGKIVRVPIETLDVAGAEVDRARGRGHDRHRRSGSRRESSFVVTDSRLYVVYQLGGPSEIRVFDLDGQAAAGAAAVAGGVRRATSTPLGGDDVLFENGLVRPAGRGLPVRRRDGQGRRRRRFAADEPVDLDDAEVVREFAASKDGTKVPVNIIFRKGTQRDGTNPCLVTAYGGYGVSIPPRLPAAQPRAARPRLRHRDGQRPRRRRVRRGLAPPGQPHQQAERVRRLRRRAAAPDRRALHVAATKLAIIGGSNGGLLMGATLTQHPELHEGRRRARRHLRHAARRALAQRRVQRHRVRHGEEPGAVPGAAAPTRRTTTCRTAPTTRPCCS